MEEKERTEEQRLSGGIGYLVLADRERELLKAKGPCSNRDCRLHYAHSGPCDMRPSETPPPVRSWALPPEPGPEVTAVSAVAGEILFTRDLMDPRYWAGRFVHSGRSFGTPVSWRDLVSRYDLTDATQETTHG